MKIENWKLKIIPVVRMRRRGGIARADCDETISLF